MSHFTDKNSPPPSPTTPLLYLYQSSSASSSGSGSRFRPVGRTPTFMQTSVPNRRNIMRAFSNMMVRMLFELVLPIALYYCLRLYFSPMLSLVLAGVPPALVVVVKAAREHKVDMMSLLMVLGFLASLVLAMLESDPKLYLLRESAMTSAMGLMLVASLLPLRWGQHLLRPFMFYVARQIAISSTVMIPKQTVRLHWDWFWRNWSSFRTFFRLLTAAWGIGLISEFCLRVVLILSLDDVDDIMYYSNAYMFVITAFLGVLTIASALLFRHLYNREQIRYKAAERRSEIEEIIARAAAEERQQRSDAIE